MSRGLLKFLVVFISLVCIVIPSLSLAAAEECMTEGKCPGEKCLNEEGVTDEESRLNEGKVADEESRLNEEGGKDDGSRMSEDECSDEESGFAKESSLSSQADQKISGKSTFSITVGEKVRLAQTARTELSYSSSNSEIAAVDGKGVVKAKRAGNVVITVKAIETELYFAAVKKIKVSVDRKNYSKLTTIGILSSKSLTKLATVKSGSLSSHIPQAMAYRGDNNITVCFNNDVGSRQIIRNYKGNSCKKTAVRTDLRHSNGMSYCKKKNALYIVDSHGSSRKSAVVLNGSSLKKVGSLDIIKKTGAIGYDRKFEGMYLGVNGKFYVKQSSKYIRKKPKYTWQQDICGYNGYIYSCVSLDKSKNNRIDVYGINGRYYGSFKLKLSGVTELESVDVDENGRLLLLVNYRCVAGAKTIDKVFRSKKALAY